LDETCSAGGGVSESNRGAVPCGCPDPVIRRGSEPVIGNDLLYTQAYYAVVTYPLYAVPHQIVFGNPLDRNEPVIRQDRLTLSDA